MVKTQGCDGIVANEMWGNATFPHDGSLLEVSEKLGLGDGFTLLKRGPRSAVFPSFAVGPC